MQPLSPSCPKVCKNCVKQGLPTVVGWGKRDKDSWSAFITLQHAFIYLWGTLEIHREFSKTDIIHMKCLSIFLINDLLCFKISVLNLLDFPNIDIMFKLRISLSEKQICCIVYCYPLKQNMKKKVQMGSAYFCLLLRCVFLFYGFWDAQNKTVDV